MALHQLFHQNLQPLRIITNRAFVAVTDKGKRGTLLRLAFVELFVITIYIFPDALLGLPRISKLKSFATNVND